MIPLTAGLIFLLCVQYMPLAEGGYRYQQYQELLQGFYDYYACIIQCYKSVYQLKYITGNLCNGQPNASDDWDYVEFKYIKRSLDCITVQCRSTLPPSVCTKGSNGYRRTQGANSYDSNGSKKDIRNRWNGRYPSPEDSDYYYYGYGTGKGDNNNGYYDYKIETLSDATASAATSSPYNTDSSTDSSSPSSLFTPSSTPTSMRRNKNYRKGNINKGNAKTSNNDSPWKKFPAYYYTPDDSGDNYYEDYYYGDNNYGDNGKGPQNKKKGKLGTGKKGSSEDAEKKLVLSMQKYMNKGKNQPQEAETTYSSTISPSPSSTDIFSSTENDDSSTFTDGSKSTSVSAASTDSSSSTDYVAAIAGISSDDTSDDSDGYYSSSSTDSPLSSSSSASSCNDYEVYEDYSSSSSSSSASYLPTESTESSSVSSDSYTSDYDSAFLFSSPSDYTTDSYYDATTEDTKLIWGVVGSDKSSADETGAPKNLDKTRKPQNRKSGSNSAHYPPYNKDNVPNDRYNNNGNFGRFTGKNGQFGYGQSFGGQVIGGNAGNDYNNYRDNYQGAAAPNSYSYQWKVNQGNQYNPYRLNPPPSNYAGVPGRPGGTPWGSRGPGGQPGAPGGVMWSNGGKDNWSIRNKWENRRLKGQQAGPSDSWRGSGPSRRQTTASSRSDSRDGPSGGYANAYSMSDSRNGPSGGYANAYSKSNSRNGPSEGYANAYSESDSRNGPSGGYANAYSESNSRNGPSEGYANAYSESDSRNGPSGGYANTYDANSYGQSRPVRGPSRGPSRGQSALDNSANSGGNYPRKITNNSPGSNSQKQEAKRQQALDNVKILMGHDTEIDFRNGEVQVWNGPRLISDMPIKT